MKTLATGHFAQSRRGSDRRPPLEWGGYLPQQEITQSLLGGADENLEGRHAGSKEELVELAALRSGSCIHGAAVNGGVLPYFIVCSVWEADVQEMPSSTPALLCMVLRFFHSPETGLADLWLQQLQVAAHFDADLLLLDERAAVTTGRCLWVASCCSLSDAKSIRKSTSAELLLKFSMLKAKIVTASMSRSTHHLRACRLEHSAPAPALHSLPCGRGRRAANGVLRICDFHRG
jgi:hypothetical protein